MTVYVDDFKASYGNMRMSHMLADTDDELHAMADKIGVARRWHQAHTMSGSHYDIAQSKVALAIKHGATLITYRQAAFMAANRRKTGQLGEPDPYYGSDYDPSKGRVVFVHGRPAARIEAAARASAMTAPRLLSTDKKENQIMQATTDGSVKIEFMPRVGSVVEFLSDRQAEKGPSSGTVLSCDWNNHTCVIRHSDHPGQTFDMRKLEVVKFVRRNPNDPQRRDYWGLR